VDSNIDHFPILGLDVIFDKIDSTGILEHFDNFLSSYCRII